MSNRANLPFTKRDLEEVAELLREHVDHANRIAGPLHALQESEDALEDQGVLDREKGDHLTWTAEGALTLVRGT